MENAFKELLVLKPYRFVAVQSGPISSKYHLTHIDWTVLIFRSFNKEAELWLCGDFEQTEELSYKDYRKHVYTRLDNLKKDPLNISLNRLKLNSLNVSNCVNSSVEILENDHQKFENYLHFNQNHDLWIEKLSLRSQKDNS